MSNKIILRPYQEKWIADIRTQFKKGWAAFQSAKSASSYDELLEIAKIVGFKKGWAWHQWQKMKGVH